MSDLAYMAIGWVLGMIVFLGISSSIRSNRK